MQLAQEQRLSCPPEFQQRITEAGGVNKYDEPSFRIVWAQSHEATIRAGGVWENPQIPTIEYYRGYRDVPVDGGEPHWLIQQWLPPDAEDEHGNKVFGSPAYYYAVNFDPSCNMQILGEYPYSGRYMTTFPLVSKDGFAMPLNSWLVDFVIPMIVWAKQISLLQKRAVIAERRAREKQNRTNEIADIIMSAKGLGEIRSAEGLSCVSALQKKMESIERYWASGCDFVRKQGKGFSQAN
jgi:hypothetical protein